MTQEIRFVTVEIQLNPWDAQVTRALLQSEGVPAFLTNEHQVHVYWPISLLLGGVRVLVPLSCLVSAREVLALRDNGALQEALGVEWPDMLEPPAPQCMSCGSTQMQTKKDKLSIVLSVLLLFFCRAPFPPVKVHECRNCGAVMP